MSIHCSTQQLCSRLNRWIHDLINQFDSLIELACFSTNLGTSLPIFVYSTITHICIQHSWFSSKCVKRIRNTGGLEELLQKGMAVLVKDRKAVNIK
jgi:hypothetical protein